MIRILLIVFLVALAFNRIFKFLRGFGTPSQATQSQQGPFSRTSSQQSRRTDGNVNIDFIPEKKKRKMSSKGSNAGEYVDYEELD